MRMLKLIVLLLCVVESYGYWARPKPFKYTLGHRGCVFERGDGIGGTEFYAGYHHGDKCIDACLERKRSDNSINGVLVFANSFRGCYCEKRMKSIHSTGYSRSYMTCWLRDNVHWSQWGTWGPCIASTGQCIGKRSSTRRCIKTKPSEKECVGDNTKYKNCVTCGTDCTFNEGDCGYTMSGLWRRRSGATPSYTTGPTTDVDGHGSYVFTEATGATAYQKSILTSPEFKADVVTGHSCVSFMFHMYGRTMGSLKARIDGDGDSTVLWSLSGNQGNEWRRGEFDVSSSTPFKLTFVGTRGLYYTGDSALDNIFVRPGPCVHGNWGDWGDYGACTRTCGNGIKIRSRLCSNPSSRYVGLGCLLSDGSGNRAHVENESVECDNLQPCADTTVTQETTRTRLPLPGPIFPHHRWTTSNQATPTTTTHRQQIISCNFGPGGSILLPPITTTTTTTHETKTTLITFTLPPLVVFPTFPILPTKATTTHQETTTATATATATATVTTTKKKKKKQSK